MPVVALLPAACEAIPPDESARGSAECKTGSNLAQRDRALPVETREIDRNPIRNQLPRNSGPASLVGG